MQLVFKILPTQQKGRPACRRGRPAYRRGRPACRRGRPACRRGRAPVEVILKKKREIIGREEVKNAEKILEGLDKILKKNKIEITTIKLIKVDDLNKNKHTSYRIIKSIEKALKLGLNFKLS